MQSGRRWGRTRSKAGWRGRGREKDAEEGKVLEDGKTLHVCLSVDARRIFGACVSCERKVFFSSFFSCVNLFFRDLLVMMCFGNKLL